MANLKSEGNRNPFLESFDFERCQSGEADANTFSNLLRTTRIRSSHASHPAIFDCPRTCIDVNSIFDAQNQSTRSWSSARIGSRQLDRESGHRLSRSFAPGAPPPPDTSSSTPISDPMLPFTSTSGSKAVSRHHVSGYSNGYPRGNTFEISPHRFVTTNFGFQCVRFG